MDMKKVNSELIINGIGITLLFFILATIYYLMFPIKSDNSNLEEYALGFLNISNTEAIKQPTYNIEIYDSLSFGNNKYVVFQLDNKLGEIDLVKGINGRYRIDSISHGTGNFNYGVRESKGKKYFLFAGKNTDLLIHKVSFILEGKEYSIDTPTKSYFLIHFEVDHNTQSIYPDPNSIRFYSIDGKDITQQVERNTLISK